MMFIVNKADSRLHPLWWVFHRSGRITILSPCRQQITSHAQNRNEGLKVTSENIRTSKASHFASWLPPSPRSVLPKLPLLMVKPLSHTPYPVQSLLLKSVLSRLFRQALEQGELDFLRHKWLNIEIPDARINWFFSCDSRQKVLTRKDGSFDVSIRGNLKSFALLAAQKEDPDTLFFQRDLIIEGDTDLGLSVKNLLDSLDWDSLPPEVLFLLRSGAEYMALFSES